MPRKCCCLLLVLLALGGRLPAQQPATYQLDVDWLVKPFPVKARVVEGTRPGTLVMQNGLIERVWLLRPDAATVKYHSLMTGEPLIRGVKPEAQLTLDGVAIPVGGLRGQKNYSYLLDDWLDTLEARPEAFRFVRHEVGRTAPRLSWKRLPFSSFELPWPPPGVSLKMEYRATPELLLRSPGGGLPPSDRGRRLLVSDDFSSLRESWKLHSSSRHERSSFVNEGKPGEVYTPENTCAYAETEFPEGGELVECTITCGTDRSASWGPGIALVWPERTVKFYLRPGKQEFGIWDGAGERLPGTVEPEKSYRLRLRRDGKSWHCEAAVVAAEGETWTPVGRVDLSAEAGAPRAIRVGKTSRTGGGDDYSGEAGSVGRSRVDDFKVYGPLDRAALADSGMSYLEKARVTVHYEMYDGLPLLCKWVEVHNGSDRKLELDSFKSELLALVPYEDPVERRGLNVDDPRLQREVRPLEPPRQIHFESDYAFGGGDALAADQTTHFVTDPQWPTQVNYRRRLPALVEVRPPLGPDVLIEPGETFETFRTWELVFDSTDRERRGLAVRRMYRAIAPWVLENPLQLHIASQDRKTLEAAIDQAAEVGFEMVVVTFGSGLNMESEDPGYLARLRSIQEYATAKGIVLGAYSLLASRRINDATDVIHPATGRPGGAFFGNSPNLNSPWGQAYFRKLKNFFEKTGFGQMTMDGAYPGDVCASSLHQRSFENSQWSQFTRIREFYRWCRARGVFLNVPDWYYLTGTNRSGMGYREVNWSLPRAQQIIIARQNIHDGTWEKNNSQGWMFVPLIQYHGGGAAATLEPLRENLPDLEAHLANLLASGTPAAYRGRRLYDAPETRKVWEKWVGFYKRYRPILDSDLIHLRRADGQDIDYWLKVHPGLETRGLLVVFNPLKQPVRKTIRVPLYYTGLEERARVAHRDEESVSFELDRGYAIRLPVEVPARGCTWFVIR